MTGAWWLLRETQRPHQRRGALTRITISAMTHVGKDDPLLLPLLLLVLPLLLLLLPLLLSLPLGEEPLGALPLSPFVLLAVTTDV